MENERPAIMQPPAPFKPWQRTLLTVVACVGTTLLATPLLGYLDLANIVMLFLLTVLLIAVTLGRSSAVLASVLSVLLFDIFFVPPRFSLAVNNIQYLVTFAVMLAVAHWAAGLTGAPLSVLGEHKGPVSALAISPANPSAIAANNSGPNRPLTIPLSMPRMAINSSIVRG